MSGFSSSARSGPHLGVERDYRARTALRPGEHSFRIMVGETDLFVTARKTLAASLPGGAVDLREAMTERIHVLRGELAAYLELHSEFLHSFIPVSVPSAAPDLVHRMARAAEICGVGPMAAVAGAIAQAAAEPFLNISPDLLVENGGDLFLASTRPRIVALLAEPDSGARLGLAFPAEAFPLSLCSSSGRIGHSISLGQGDLVTVRSSDAALADAAATALANLLRTAADLQTVLARAQALAPYGLTAVFAQCQGRIAAWGDLELVTMDE